MFIRPCVFKNFILVYFLLASIGGRAQGERPLVGLVLGGSGANGLANIGVLSVLEEQGIQPDFIVGTGFGALIGGLYSMGYSVDEIEEVMLSQDWDELLGSRTSYQELTVEEKEYSNKSIIDLPVQKDLQIIFEGNLNSGFRFYKFISRLCLPAKNMAHFDFLPIPFRCVATDQKTEKPVSLSQGDLAEAIYASLVMPTAFDPLHMDSTILVEGPITNPLPASVARAMGAEIVIGTYIPVQPLSITDQESTFGVLSSSTYANGRREAEQQKQWVDLLIEPEMSAYSNLDFHAIPYIIASGRSAALGMTVNLRSLSDAIRAAGPAYTKDFYLDPILTNNLATLDEAPKSVLQSYWDYLSARADPDDRDSLEQQLILDSVAISGIRQFSRREVLNILELPPGKPIDPNKIREGVNRLEQLGEFTFISYEVEARGNRNILQLRCREKPPGTLRAGVFYNSYQQAGINLGFTSRNFILPGSRINLAASLNNYHRIQLAFLNYLDTRQQISYGLHAHYRQNLVSFIHKDEQSFRLNDLRLSNHWNLYLGGHTKMSVGIGWEEFTYNIVDRPASPAFEKVNIRNLFTGLGLKINSLDDPVLPRSGAQATADYTYRLRQEFNMQTGEDRPEIRDSTGNFNPFHQILISARKILPLGVSQAIDARGFSGLSIGTTSPFQNHFVIGPPERLMERSLPSYGLNTYEWAATLAVGGSLAFQHFFSSNLMGSLHLNGGYFELPDPVSSAGQRTSGLNYGMGGTLIYNTAIGPIRATLSYLESAEEKLAAGTRFFLAYGYRF